MDAGGWRPIVSASRIAFRPDWIEPEPLDQAGIDQVIAGFQAAAARALQAGFDVVEVHAAHGYLLHQFYSPISNERIDDYGVTFDNRTRLVREVVSAVRKVWPESKPLFVRISATDYVDGGWTLDDSVKLCQSLKALGADLIDCSSGGNVPEAKIPVGPGYQVPFAARIRSESGIATGAVGMITEPAQAEEILSSGQADLVIMARELLRDPYWPRRAAKELSEEIQPPAQYARAW